MIRFKIKSPFKFVVLLVINCFIHHPLIAILSFLYFLLFDLKELLLFLFLFACVTYFNAKTDFISIGLVSEINGNMAIVEKGLYKVRTYNSNQYEIGDIVFFEDEESSFTSDYYIKQNILFKSSDNHHKLINLVTRKAVHERILGFNEEIQEYINKLVFNSKSNNDDIEIDYIGYGFCFYYLLLIIKRKNKGISILLLCLYVLFFQFDIKFYLFIIDLFLSKTKFSRFEKLCIEIVVLLMINQYLLHNYSILLTLLFQFLFLSEFKNSKVLFAIIQSLFFGEIKVFTSFLYKYYILIRLILFFFTIFLLLFPFLSFLYLPIISIVSKVLSLINISIRGKIGIIVFLSYLFISKCFHFKKENYKFALICLLMLLPINNPFHHISFINVGQGDATLIHGTMNSYNILIDTGSLFNYSRLKSSLFDEGVYTIDYLIISHEDEDHSGNVERLKKDFNIKEIVTTGKDITIDDMNLKYLYLGQYDNTNDNSLVYLYERNNFKVLFTGDISSSVENRIIYNYNLNEIDVLKLSHHGSNTASSSYFIGSLLPKVGIISTSGQYNHPSKEVMNILNSYFVNSYITKESGTIKIYDTFPLCLLKTERREFVII